MATLTGTVRSSINAVLKKALDLTTPTDVLANVTAWAIATGNGDQKADEMFHDQRTLADGVSEDLPLAGSLSNAFGDTVAFVRIKALKIEIVTGTANLLIGGAVATAWETWVVAAGDKVLIRGGIGTAKGRMEIVAPDGTAYVVGAGATDLLRIEHDSGDATAIVYNIIIIGDTV